MTESISNVYVQWKYILVWYGSDVGPTPDSGVRRIGFDLMHSARASAVPGKSFRRP